MNEPPMLNQTTVARFLTPISLGIISATLMAITIPKSVAGTMGTVVLILAALVLIMTQKEVLRK